MSTKEKEEQHTTYVIMCCVNVRPFNMARQSGFQYFIGGLCPAYVPTTLHHDTMSCILDGLVDAVRDGIIAKLKAQLDSTKELGYDGPVFGVESDMTSTQGVLWSGTRVTCEMVSDGGGRFIPAGIVGLHTSSSLLASLVVHDGATEDNHTHHTGRVSYTNIKEGTLPNTTRG